MNSNEWPLVFFTILTQLSVGILFAAFVLSFFLKDTDAPALAELKRMLIFVALGSIGLALIISFLHLASPQHAVYAITNPGSSWLSREILLGIMYFVSLLICFTSWQYSIPHRSMFDYFFLASLLTGVILVWAMASVYMIPTVPLWNSPSTPVAFFNTALMLGSGALLVMLIGLASHKAELPEIRSMQSTLFYMIAFAVFVFLLNKMMLQPDISSVPGGFAAPVVSSLWKTVQYIFLVAGFTMLTYWFARHAASLPGQQIIAAYLVYGAVLMLLLAEIAARYVFYASYYRIGI